MSTIAERRRLGGVEPCTPRTCALLLSLALVPAACHESGAEEAWDPPAVHEVEPNDTATEAVALGRGTDGIGDVAAAGDVDYWSARMTKGSIARVELFAARLDQSGWDASGNIARLTLYDTDGVTRLLEHDYGGHTTTNGSWDWGKHDLGFSMFRVPVTGTYFIAVTQDETTLPGGAYAIRWSQSESDGLRVEAEPEMATGLNDDFTTAEPITPGSLYGFHVAGESDFYSFHVGQHGSVVKCEITSYRNGVWGGKTDSYDPRLVLYDTNGVTRLTENDDSYFYDAAVEYWIARPGTYFIEVTESHGAGDAPYSLRFQTDGLGDVQPETEPNDTAMAASALVPDDEVAGQEPGLVIAPGPPPDLDYRAAGTLDVGDVDYWSFSASAGDVLRLQWFDRSNAQGIAADVEARFVGPDGATFLSQGGCGDFQTLTTILQEAGTYFVEVQAPGVADVSEYGLNLYRFRSASIEVEPNDDLATVNVIGSNRPRAGAIDGAGDRDVFSFEARADRLVAIAIHADRRATGSDGAFEFSGHGSRLHPLLTIRDAMGAVLAESTSNPARSVYSESSTDALPTACVAFLPTVGGTYFVEVADANGSFGPDHAYVIERE